MHKPTTIAFAQGFIEDFIDSSTQPRDIPEGLDEEETLNISEDNEHSEQVREMWKVVSEGLDQLRRANTSLENKLALIDQARNTPT